MKKCVVISLSLLSGLLVAVGVTYAHGVVGKRFIPSTMTLEDPFPSDEMDLLSVERGSKNKEGRETAVGFEFSKRLHPDFAIGVEWEYLFVEPRESGARRTSGAGNPEFSLKYALFRSAEREGILSIGLGVEPGGIGPKRVAERITTVGVNIPSRRRTVITSIEDGEVEREVERHPTTIAYGIALMYSIPYLQSFVRDVGLSEPFSRLFPLAEFNFETNASRPDRGQTTAFFNPGVIWAGRYFQLGMQAQVPMNSQYGKNVGVKGVIHLFLDDIAPSIFTWTPWGGHRPHSEMTRLTQQTLALLLALILPAAAVPGEVGAHAFPIRSDPRVGWTISNSPPSVKIWFDGELEPAFSTTAVYNSAKQRVDRGNGRVSPSDGTLLEVDLPALPSGTYHVHWVVVSKDTHRTEGDFPFTIDGKAP